jgi:hypothetical protein
MRRLFAWLLLVLLLCLNGSASAFLLCRRGRASNFPPPLTLVSINLPQGTSFPHGTPGGNVISAVIVSTTGAGSFTDTVAITNSTLSKQSLLRSLRHLPSLPDRPLFGFHDHGHPDRRGY